MEASAALRSSYSTAPFLSNNEGVSSAIDVASATGGDSAGVSIATGTVGGTGVGIDEHPVKINPPTTNSVIINHVRLLIFSPPCLKAAT